MIIINKWSGLATNASKYAVPPGATVEQVNVQCLVPGQLTVRPGFQQVTFPNVSGTSDSIACAVRYQHGQSEHIVYQTSAGEIYSSVVPASIFTTTAAPSPPVIASAIPGQGSIVVTATPPSSSGTSAVTGYAFQVSSDNKATWTAAGSSSGVTATLGGLTAGVGYFIRAAASNASGLGDYGPAYGVVSPITTAATTAPSSPQSVSAVAGNAMASVRWGAPSSTGNSPITSYTVQMSSDRGLSWATVGTTSSLSLDAASLTQNTDYIFRVSATNAIGTSAYSVPSAAVTTSGSILVPSVPPSFTSTSTSTTISSSWEPPTSTGGSAITGYSFGYKMASDASWTTVTTAGTSYVLTGLTPSTQYNVRVAATNSDGTGSYATHLSAIATKAAVTATFPTAPQGFAVDLSYLAYTASWSPPLSNGGAAITAYKLERSNSPSGPWTLETEDLLYVFNKQVASSGSVSHYFRVSAKNSAGYGPSAIFSASIISPPTAPRNLAVTVSAFTTAAESGSYNAVLSWDPPIDNGGADITRYSVSLNYGDQKAPLSPVSPAGTGRQSVNLLLDYGRSGTLYITAANGQFAGAEASVAFTMPAERTNPLLPVINSAAGSGNTVSLAFAPSPNETTQNLSLMHTGGLYWYAEYSTNSGATYTPVSIGTVCVGVPADGYLGTYTSINLVLGRVATETVIIRLAIGAYPADTLDTSQPHSPWAYTQPITLPA